MFYNSLKIKTVSLIVLVVVLFNSYSMYYKIKNIVEYERANMEYVNRLFLDSQASIVVRNYWTLDYEGLEKVLDAFERFPNFISATLYDDKNTLIAQRVVAVEFLSENTFSIEKSLYQDIGDKKIYLGRIVYETGFNNLTNMVSRFVYDAIAFQLVLVILLCVLIFFIINKLIVNPLEKISARMSAIARGDAYVDIPYIDRNDAIGTVAKAVCVFRENLFKILEFERNARKDAEEVNKLKDLFFARITHELRTPLHGISGFTDMMLEDLKDNENIGYAKNIRKLTLNMIRLVNDILDFSKLREGGVELTPSICDLRISMATLCSAVQGLVDKNHNQLNFKIRGDFPEAVYVDILRLEQVLLNLLSNASKFTNYGKITVGIECLKNENGIADIRFVVEDTGIGISQKFQEDGLFKSFNQEENKISRSYGGTGLGLAIAYNFVSVLGGTLEVESQKGFGAKFYFTLHLKTAKSSDIQEIISTNDYKVLLDNINQEKITIEEGKEKSQPQQNHKQPLHTVLVADDDPMNRLLLQKLVERSGYKCVLANNGKEAVEKFEASNVDIILMDVMMPIVDGIEATRKIRELGEKGANVPIIAVTAFVNEENKQNCLSAGMNDFMTKPFNTENLLKVFSAYLKD